MKSPLLKICRSVWRHWCWGFQAVKCGFEAADVGFKYGLEAVDVGSKYGFATKCKYDGLSFVIFEKWWLSHKFIWKLMCFWENSYLL